MLCKLLVYSGTLAAGLATELIGGGNAHAPKLAIGAGAIGLGGCPP